MLSLPWRLAVGALNHLLADAPWATARLARHAGARVTLEGGPFRAALRIGPTGHLLADEGSDPPEVTLTLPDDAPLRLLTDRERLFAGMRLAGAADVAETLGFVFRHLDWDAEGDLARVVGDIPARRLTRAGRAAWRTTRTALARGVENVAEYAGGDGHLILDKATLTAFRQTLAEAAAQLDRLEKRAESLQ